MNFSLRRRLFVWLSAAILIAALLAAVLSFKFSYEDANEIQDGQLEQLAAVLGSQTISSTPRRIAPTDPEDAENQIVVRLLGPAPLHPDSSLDFPLPLDLAPGLQTVEELGERWRVVVSEDAAGRRFAVAQRTAIRDEQAGDSAFLTLVPLLALVPVLLLIVGLILRQAFAPMTRLCGEVDRIDGTDLAALDERHVPVESLALVQAVNRLMQRLGGLLEQQRRLVSDAAHELRTPLAALIVQADNVQHVDLPPEANDRMATLRRGLSRMSALIDQLLNLARIQGQSTSARQALDLHLLVRTAIEDSLQMARAKNVDLGCPRIDTAVILGDPLQAYALARNAVDNAVRYTPPGGAVDVSVTVEAGHACLVVEDSGPGLDDADVERVFEPFFRVVGTREAGSGLGLTIVRTAAAALGGSVGLSKRLDGRPGLRFVYRQAMTVSFAPGSTTAREQPARPK